MAKRKKPVTRRRAPTNDRQELEAALERARADTRAARDEIARLTAENDALRARLDEARAGG